MKTLLTLVLLIPSLSWGVQLTSIWSGKAHAGFGEESVTFEISLQAYSGPEEDDLLEIFLRSPDNVSFNTEKYQFTKGKRHHGYKGEEDFLCLKSTFEKAAEWVEIAKKNSIENARKDINLCDWQYRITWPGQLSIYSFRFQTEILDLGLPTQFNRLHMTLFVGGLGEFIEVWINEFSIQEILDVLNDLENYFQDIRNENLQMEKDLKLFQ